MGFMDYEKVFSKYEGDLYMTKILNGMMQLDEYHLLRDSDVSLDELSWMPPSMELFKQWLSVSDGGYLFASTLFCVHGFDKVLDIHFQTLEEASKKKNDYCLPDGYVIIALRNYGAPICMTSTDEKVRLWDAENKRVATLWDSFADFLGDELNMAIDLIEDEALASIPLKAEEA